MLKKTYQESLASNSLEPCRRILLWEATPRGHREIPHRYSGSDPSHFPFSSVSNDLIFGI